MDQALIEMKIRAWAERDDNIRAVVITGSVARGKEASDSLSDLDVELYARDPSLLLDQSDWYSQFGEVLVVEALTDPDWYPSRLVYYVDGKADFAIADTHALREKVPYLRPFRVLLDKDAITLGLCEESPEQGPPSPADFNRVINWFYAAALMCAKCIVRDEPWMAKMRDWDLKTQLLQMIEWDHKARHGWDYDTWYRGAHMREWIDDEIMKALDKCWADFSLENTASALLACVTLFDRLTQRTARALHVPTFISAVVHREIDRVLNLSRRAPA